MKYVVFIYFHLFLIFSSQAQNQPVIKWQKCYGGSFIDKGYAITKAGNDQYILAGFTESNDGQVSGNHSAFNKDFWIVKINGTGNLLWQKCLGGNSYESAYSIVTTFDNGLIVAGNTNSNDGDVTGNHTGIDYWVVKLDSMGIIQWQKCLGGSGTDEAYSIIQTTDGGYAVAGYSMSFDGEVTGNHGDRDYWVARLDSIGTILWQKCLGGNSYDEAKAIIQSADGGFAVVGETYSFNNGDVTGSNGEYDCWVAKLDSSGNLEWQKSLGGNSQDRGYCIEQKSNGDFMVGAYLGSYGMNLCSGMGDYDYWIVQLNSLGSLVDQHCFGGEHSEYVNAMIPTNEGGFAYIGKTTSYDQEVPDSHGDGIEDFWLVVTDSTGNLLTSKALGGSSMDVGTGIIQADNNDFIVTGYTFSNDGDVKGSHGQFDFWVARVALNYNSITGTCFIDNNNNLIHDAGELPVKYFPITNLYTTSGFTNSTGKYTINVFDSGNYVTAPELLPYYNIVPSFQNSSFTGINQTDSLIDFAFQPAGNYNDLTISLIPATPFRSGFNAKYTLIYSNQGTTTLNPTITFFPDANLTFISASVNPTLNNIDSLVWIFGPLLPFETGSIEITFNVNAATPINSLINSMVQIEPINGDAFTNDNNDSWEVFTIGSFDPNDILVNRDTIFDFEMVSPPFLEYVIRFQNTGNAPADYVKVENNIPDKLDLSTFELIGSSHNLNMIYEPHSRLMKFIFNNINLPDSGTNYLASNGFIKYRIKPIPSLGAGENLPNNAAIYFDFNPAVSTNTVNTEIVVPTSLNEGYAEHTEFWVYPNPALHEINVRFYSYQTKQASIEIWNIYGQNVKTINMEFQNSGIHELKFDVSNLMTGVYFIRLENETKIIKFVKLKN